jgi:hypothetical protein
MTQTLVLGGRLSRILEKYQTNSGKILWDEKHKVRVLQFSPFL